MRYTIKIAMGYVLAAAAMCVSAFSVAAPAPADKKSDAATIVLHSTITGDQEQPKVLYIVPWQSPGSADQLQQPLKPVLDDVFAPVDRAEFQRELKYREEMAAPSSTSTPAVQP